MSKVIGLTGYAGSGKSTVAQYLVDRHGYTRLSLAAPLKKMVLTLDPFVSSGFDDQFYRVSEILDNHGETEAKKLFPEYRRLLQVIGTDCIRSIDPEFWIKAAEKNLTDPEGKYVFDDVRFHNEAELITRYSPEGLWNIQRPGYEAVNGHSSEQHAGKMGEFLTIDNTDLERLHSGIDLAVEFYFRDVASSVST